MTSISNMTDRELSILSVLAESMIRSPTQFHEQAKRSSDVSPLLKGTIQELRVVCNSIDKEENRASATYQIANTLLKDKREEAKEAGRALLVASSRSIRLQQRL